MKKQLIISFLLVSMNCFTMDRPLNLRENELITKLKYGTSNLKSILEPEKFNRMNNFLDGIEQFLKHESQK